jgi:hypothetical protein
MDLAKDPNNRSEREYWRSLSYRCALDVLPFLLEKSAISLELAEVLRGCTFTTMGQRFPRRIRLAKDAITRYLLRVGLGWASRELLEGMYGSLYLLKVF